MDKTVPIAAQYILNFIASIEAPKGYVTIYGNNQNKLKKPITSMTLRELLNAQKTFTAQFKSSASGRYQFMRSTLVDLINELKLRPEQKFTPDLQDRLGYHLLRRRGYDAFMFGKIDLNEFAKRLAQEWASLPILAPIYRTIGDKRVLFKRGQSFYDNDGLNNEGVSADTFEKMLKHARELHEKAPAAPEVKPQKTATKVATGAVVGTAATAATSVDWTPLFDVYDKLGSYGPTVAMAALAVVTVGIGYVIWRKLK